MKRMATILVVFGIAFLILILLRQGDGRYSLLDLLRGRPAPTMREESFTPRLEPKLKIGDMKLLARINEEFARLTDAVVPSVVSINTTTKVIVPRTYVHPFGAFFGRYRRNEVAERPGLGSGAIISKEGHILTNHHVVSNGERYVDKIVVALPSGESYPAKVIGSSPSVDIAVLRIEGDHEFPALRLADSDKARVGEMVFAVGNPFGLNETVTRGIISAKERRLSDSTPGLFQTNAIINPGSSGGPLVNVQGDIIGVNVAIFTGQENVHVWQGVGLAIPSNEAREVVEAILERGVPVWGYLGIVCDDLDPVSATRLGLRMTYGARITKVTAGSPADNAGLRADDVVIRYMGRKMTSKKQLLRAIRRTQAGEPAEIVLLRGGKELTLSATVGELEEAPAVTTADPDDATKAGSLQKYGLAVRDLGQAEKTRIGMYPAILVTEVVDGSAAANARLQAGCLIHEVDRRQIASAQEFYDYLETAQGATVSLGVTTRAGRSGYTQMRIR